MLSSRFYWMCPNREICDFVRNEAQLMFILWDLQLDEGDVRRLANLARLLSMLIASKAVPITVVKASLVLMCALLPTFCFCPLFFS